MSNKVLIVDDDGPILKALHLRFSHSGFDVLCAKDAISALNIMRQEKPEAAILDINMPGLDGFALSKKIADQADIPVFFMSANKSPGLLETAQACNAVGFYEKPLDSKSLVREVTEILSESEDVQAVG